MQKDIGSSGHIQSVLFKNLFNGLFVVFTGSDVLYGMFIIQIMRIY